MPVVPNKQKPRTGMSGAFGWKSIGKSSEGFSLHRPLGHGPKHKLDVARIRSKTRCRTQPSGRLGFLNSFVRGGRSVFVGRVLVLNIRVMAEALGNVGELLDGLRRRHRLRVPVGDDRLAP